MTVLVVCTVILAVSCISGLVKGFTGKASGILDDQPVRNTEILIGYVHP